MRYIITVAFLLGAVQNSFCQIDSTDSENLFYKIINQYPYFDLSIEDLYRFEFIYPPGKDIPVVSNSLRFDFDLIKECFEKFDEPPFKELDSVIFRAIYFTDQNAKSYVFSVKKVADEYQAIFKYDSDNSLKPEHHNLNLLTPKEQARLYKYLIQGYRVKYDIDSYYPYKEVLISDSLDFDYSVRRFSISQAEWTRKMILFDYLKIAEKEMFPNESGMSKSCTNSYHYWILEWKEAGKNRMVLKTRKDEQLESFMQGLLNILSFRGLSATGY